MNIIHGIYGWHNIKFHYFIKVFSESALLRWEPPAEPNGRIQKYVLGWHELQPEKEGQTSAGRNTTANGEIEISAHQLNYTIQGLRPKTNYGVEIAVG